MHFFIIEPKIPPTITPENTVYKVKQNDDVTVNLKFIASPKPTVEWYQSKNILKKSPKLSPTFDEQSASLTIRKIVDTDAGEYTVKVFNEYGTAEVSITIIIMRKLLFT